MEISTSTISTITAPRPLAEIAWDIQQDWTKPFYGAVPYITAMAGLVRTTDKYFEDSAESIIRYFLTNATTWRGETARRIKAELRGMLP